MGKNTLGYEGIKGDLISIHNIESFWYNPQPGHHHHATQATLLNFNIDEPKLCAHSGK